MINLTFPHYIYNIPDSRYASIPISQHDSSRYLCSLHPDISACSIQISLPASSRYLSLLHPDISAASITILLSSTKWSPRKRQLTNATIRINPHGYSHKPSRLLESAISTIRIAHFDYSCKPSRLLAFANDTKKPRSRSPEASVCDKKTIAIKQCSWS